MTGASVTGRGRRERPPSRSVDSTDAKGEGLSAVAQRIALAALK